MLTSYPPGHDVSVIPYSKTLVGALKVLRDYMMFTSNNNFGYSIIKGPRVIMTVAPGDDWYHFKLRFHTNKDETMEIINSKVIHIFDNPMLV